MSICSGVGCSGVNRGEVLVPTLLVEMKCLGEGMDSKLVRWGSVPS
jgi:hypothetical protein